MTTIRTETRGAYQLRLVRLKTGKFAGVLLNGKQAKLAHIEGAGSEDVWQRLHDQVLQADPAYFGFPEAISRFKRFCPEGFADPVFRGQEDDYKRKARDLLLQSLRLEDVIDPGPAECEAAHKVVTATNLLSPFEKMKTKELLRSPTGPAFLQAAADFTRTSAEAGLHAMARLARPFGCAGWTCLTYLPFLWRPEDHMVLKPEVTKDFAARVGHGFALDYRPEIVLPVYASLLALVAGTERELRSAGLPPRDHIDVQSFIWIVGKYGPAAAPSGSQPA